jgi:uncharacterized protein (TIGR01244 family)
LTRALFASIASLAFALAGQAADVGVLADLPHVRFPEAHRVVSGAIDPANVEQLREAGIRHVINLRPIAENPQFDEAGVVEAHGLRYHYLPIEGARSLTRDNVLVFDRILSEVGNEPALIHCSTGNRVGALIALREAWVRGREPQEAIEEGKRWGLTRLEDNVRAALER